MERTGEIPRRRSDVFSSYDETDEAINNGGTELFLCNVKELLICGTLIYILLLNLRLIILG